MRVLTYNIRHGTDFLGRARLANQAEVIASSGADVVFLQEVDRGTRRSGRGDLAARLAALSGLPHVAFGANHRLDDGEFGNAILSRWPLSEVANHPLPAPPHDRHRRWGWRHLLEGRGILEAAVCHEGVRVRLLCAHFGFLPEEPALSAQAALALMGRDDRALVFGGDLNRPAARALCHRLLGEQLLDCAAEAGSRPAATFPAPWPRLRLDYLYVRGLQVRQARVLASAASDHRPVLAELAVSPAHEPSGDQEPAELLLERQHA